MKKFYFTLYLVCMGLLAAAQEPFSKLYEYFLGNYGSMFINNVIQARNSDYLMSGAVYVGNVGMTNYILVAADSSGNLKWMKEIDIPDWWVQSTESDIIQTLDNGFAFCGNDPFGGGFIVKYDPAWNISWNKAYLNEMNPITIDRVSEDNTGSYYAYGTAIAIGPNSDMRSWDLLLMKLDSEGNILKQVTVGIPGNDEQSTNIVRLSSGEFVLAGRRYDSNFSNSEEILVKLDTSFEVVWAKTMSTEDQALYRIESVKEDAGGQLLVAGNIFNQNYLPEPFIAKLNSEDGTSLWIKSYQVVNDEDFSISLTDIAVENNGYITGTGRCFSDTTSMTLIFSANDSGDIIWAKRNDVSYGGYTRILSSGAAIQKTPSGGSVITGMWALVTPPFISNQYINLMQVASDGSTYCPYVGFDMAAVPSPLSVEDMVIYAQPGTVQPQNTPYLTENFLESESIDDCLALAVETRAPEVSLSVAPNPTEGNFRVTMPGANAEGDISLFNASGRKVYHASSISPAQLGAGWEISLQAVPGLYLLEVIAGRDRVTRKVIVR